MRIDEKKVIRWIDREYKEEAIKMIGYLKKKSIPYKELKKNRVMRASLVWILKHKGYTYLGNKIYRLFNRKEIDYKEVYEALINSNIIARKNIHMVTDIDLEKGIQFKEEKGIKKRYFIKLLQDNYPFKIKYISNEYNGFVNVSFKNKEFIGEIEVEINIPANVNYKINITETIVIYTDYKIKFIHFNIGKIEKEENGIYDFKHINNILAVKERTRRIIGIDRSQKFLRKTEDYRIVRDYIVDIKNIDIAFEVFRSYKKYIEHREGVYPIRNYKEIIQSFIDREEKNIKVAYLIEIFIIEKYLLNESMKNYLEISYENKYMSELTEEVLEILKFSDFNLKLKKKFNILDNETLKDFEEGNVTLEMASKILGTKGIRYSEKLLKIIYDFYQETDDVKALETIIQKKGSHRLKITDGDIVSLINKKREGIDISDRIILRGGEKYIKSNNYIKDTIERIKGKNK
ncbi:hypothetical protein [uncultured Clostridium sp.]|uniref:hypothetical protein n=1 Tax=uncultured Clostridium sp. TaxID=59620 RepID=UPI002635F684|nr:hypothetical protein [uncultured Clostridium sp.]